MKGLITAIVWLAAEAATGAAPAATWRLDFFHTGGKSGEVFSVDEVVVEPLAWPGSGGNNVDSSGFGSYRFEVRDTTGRVRFSRGYSPIYAEWMTTAEAGTQNQTFHESLRFPALTATSDIVVFRRNEENQFVEAWRTRVNPRDMFIDRSTPRRYTPIQVEHHGDPAAKVDILLLGDGYTAAECAAKFRRDTRRMADALFAVQPFKRRRGDFNV